MDRTPASAATLSPMTLLAAAAKASASAAAGPSGREPLGKQGPRILIVEDDYFIALDNEATLRAAGFDILGPAATGEEAVALALKERPALILMDIRLGGDLDGIEAAIEIQQRAGISSVFASAYADVRTRKRAAPAEPLGWLSKPFSQRELLGTVADALAEVARRRPH